MTEVKSVQVADVGDRLLVKVLEVVVAEVETCQITAITNHLLWEAPQQLVTENISSNCSYFEFLK